jgi:hypothetical protein
MSPILQFRRKLPEDIVRPTVVRTKEGHAVRIRNASGPYAYLPEGCQALGNNKPQSLKLAATKVCLLSATVVSSPVTSTTVVGVSEPKLVFAARNNSAGTKNSSEPKVAAQRRPKEQTELRPERTKRWLS